MAILPDISVRRLQPELMDDPALDASEHERALAGLRLVNRASRTARALWRCIRPIAGAPGHPPVRVLDIATGSGDVPLTLARLARRDGLALEIDGCDASDRAVGIAGGRARKAGEASRFFRLDAIRDPLPGNYDVVMSCLFMHHLPESDAIDLLYKMRAAARRMVLISDLCRSRLGLAMAYAASRLCSRSRIIRTDAILSVQGAFTSPEFASMALAAGLEGATITPMWPQRFLLEWRRP